MNELLANYPNWPLGLGLTSTVLLAVGAFSMRAYLARRQVQSISRLSKKFREEQTAWQQERNGLEQTVGQLAQELDGVNAELDELRQEHSRQNAHWQENQYNLSERVKQLYRLSKKRDKEKAEVEAKLSEAHAAWKEERDRLEDEKAVLKQQIERLERAKRTLSDANPERPAAWDERYRELNEKLAMALAQNQALTQQLREQKIWAEQVQQTLEEEVGALSGQIESMEQESADNVKALAR